MDPLNPTDAPLLATLKDGRVVPVQPCRCGGCQEEFFVAAMSEEWHPSYCCYCGMKFTRKTVDDGIPEDYRPMPTINPPTSA